MKKYVEFLLKRPFFREKEILKSLQQKVKETKVICYQTDKSGRWSCDTKENYKKACEKHLQDDSKTEVISLTEHEKAEEEMNCHAYALLRMIGLKDDVKYGHGQRIRWAMQSTNNTLAPFYCLRKDHKPIDPGKEAEGPKTRPLCGATDLLNTKNFILALEIIG